MKEELWELFVNFNWSKALVAMSTCFAIIVFIVGIVLAIATENAWWLLLWIVSVIFLGIVAGLSEVGF